MIKVQGASKKMPIQWNRTVDATSKFLRWIIMKNNPEEIIFILDELSLDENQWPTNGNERRKPIEVHQVDSTTSMQA